MSVSLSFKDRRRHLLLLQILAHFSLVPMVLYANRSHYLIAFAMYFLTGCLGMTMTYHRLLSHRSWKPVPLFEYIGTFFGTLGATGSSIAWVATHREHHLFADKPKDPHSPHFQKWYRVQFLSMLRPPQVRYAKDLIRQPFHKFLHRHYFKIHVGFALTLFLIDPFSVIYAYLFPVCVLWNAGSSINTIGHLFGYRNFKTADVSKNNLFLGYLVWGEGWHNNHHRFLKSPYFGRRWFELDIAGFLIRILSIRRS